VKNKRKDIIMLSVSRWDQELSSASISMAKELSKNGRVFYIDHPFSLKDVIKGRKTDGIRRRLKALFFGVDLFTQVEPGNPNWIAVTPGLTWPINWLPKGTLYDFFSWWNNRIFFRAIRKTIRQYQINDFIYWNSYNPFFSYNLPGDIKPSLFIYQSRDNIAHSNYVKKHGPELERRAAEYADLRIATSIDLTKRLSVPGKEFVLFPNAARTEIFKKAQDKNLPRPAELPDDGRRVIGYVGNICLRQDYDLIYKIATTYHDHVLLMVGPRNDKSYHHYDFSKLSNVIFTGPKKLEALPQYLAYMDVAILPFLVNDLTKSIYPLKLNEYLAAGKPVVSTNFSSDVQSFSEVVYISSSHAEFIDNIRKGIDDDSDVLRKKRIEAADKNSWENRVEDFWKLVNQQPSLKNGK
jgi:teichuronic acid biosynthesis glycosyltransferase TuaH